MRAKYYDLLSKYYDARMTLNNHRLEYKKLKRRCSMFLKYENQSKDTLENDTRISFIPVSERKQFYNRNCIPVTMMLLSEIRKKDASACRILKQEIRHDQQSLAKYECQIMALFKKEPCNGTISEIQ